MEHLRIPVSLDDHLLPIAQQIGASVKAAVM